MIAFAQKYECRIGLGTILSLMLPYSIAFAIGWTALLAFWLFLGIALGPRSGMVYPPA
jgi:aminobenzoyl-glutamate transport protein